MEKRILGISTLRFFAFLMIFIFHSFPHFEFGYFGVDFFYLISSFLLTFLFFKEVDKNGKFNVIHFFFRRCLKIYPLYFLILIFSFFVLPLIVSNFDFIIKLPENQFYYWFFLSNYDHSEHIFALKLLWSISLEEQFYIVFIMLSFFFLKWFKTLMLSLLLILIPFYIPFFDFLNLKSNLFNHLPFFIAGILLGKMFYYKKLKFFNLISLSSAIILSVAIYISEIEIFKILLLVIIFSLIMINLVTVISIFRLKNNPILTFFEFLGNYSYGLYIFSGFVLTFGNILFPELNEILKFSIELILLFIIAYISFHLFEKKFLNLKKYFQ